MNVCLDTDVLVDCLRGVSAAQEWLGANQSESLLVPGVVAMELVKGARTKPELDKTRNFLERFQVHWHDPREFARAFELLNQLTLSTNLSIPDCLVAATAIEHSLRLYTFNTKHYRAIPGLDVQQPYER